MGVAMVARPASLRAIPWATWVLLAVAALVLVGWFVKAGPQLGILTIAAPVVFAAAVVYAAPADRRFTWAALALAADPVIRTIWNYLPEAVFTYAPGDWRNAAFFLQDMGPIARDVASVLTIVGLGLLGLALGRARTRLSAAIVGVGVVVAIVHAILIADSFSAMSYPPGDSTPIVMLARGILISTLTVVAWAFVFAAALESRRKLMAIGTGLLFVITVLNYVTPLRETLLGNDWVALLTAIVAVHLIGWALIVLAALRGELRAARSGGSTSPG